MAPPFGAQAPQRVRPRRIAIPFRKGDAIVNGLTGALGRAQLENARPDARCAVQAGVESVRRAPAALGDFLRTSRFPVLWEDQARVVAAQDDSVLERYIAGLLDWLADPNQPGASLK